jgi:uncharacterized membrane protein YfcA
VDLSASGLLCGIVVVFAAGVIKGLTGFGFSLFTVPILVVLLGPRTAVPVIVVLNAVSNVPLYLHSRRWVSLRRTYPLILSGVVSIPLGAYLLAVLDAAVLKVIAGIVICLFALAFLLGFRKQIRHEKAGLIGAGLVSGALNGLISTGGPPAILFLTNQGMPKERFRANLIAYFLFLNIATLPIHFAAGLISSGVIRSAALFIPALALGALVGIRLVGHVPEAAFKRTVLAMVMAAGAFMALASLRVM